MKRLVVFVLVLMLTVQAQEVGQWIAFTSGKEPFIVNGGVKGSDMTMFLRCDDAKLTMFIQLISSELILSSTIYYKIDRQIAVPTIFLASSSKQYIIFSDKDARKLVQTFVTAHFFSIAVEIDDKIRAFTFDLTGFGQALQYIPCARAYLK